MANLGYIVSYDAHSSVISGGDTLEEVYAKIARDMDAETDL